MKFTQISIGTHFRYKANDYQKVSPVMAARLQGQGQKLIPRSAQIELITDESLQPSKDMPTDINKKTVKETFSCLSETLHRVVSESHIDHETKQVLQSKIQHHIEQYSTALLNSSPNK